LLKIKKRRNFLMENKEELKQKLIEKLEKELQEYKGYLRQKSPDEIIESAYQMTVKTLIIGEMSEKNLDYYELKALIKQKDLLAEFYEDWRNSDGRLGENISYEMDNSIKIIVDRAVAEKIKNNRESR